MMTDRMFALGWGDGLLAEEVADFVEGSDRRHKTAPGTSMASYPNAPTLFAVGGSGALSSIQRIAMGYPLRAVQEPIIALGETTDGVLTACEELGMAMAAGLEMRVF